MEANEDTPKINPESDEPKSEQIEKPPSQNEEDKDEDVEDLAFSDNEAHDNESRKSQSESNDNLHSETDDDDDASVIIEQEGEPQENAPNRKVDDDEDKRNPQYIPKRGTFYEHDDRTATAEGSDEVESVETEKDKDASKKKIWSEKESTRWRHDKFNDNEQAPKSRTELVSIYGYDIRNEDGPPRARRRRRYGRGPNKYTRNWEDEDAYGKTQITPPRGGSASVGGGGNVHRNRRQLQEEEEFPALGPRDKSKSSERPKSSNSGDSENSRSNRNASSDSSSAPKRDESSRSQSETSKGSLRKPEPTKLENGEHRSPRPQQYHKERTIPKTSPRIQDGPRTPQNLRGVTRTRGFKSGRLSEQIGRRQQQRPQTQEESRNDFIMSQNFTNKTMNQTAGVQDIERDVAKMSVQDAGYKGGKYGGQRQTTVPPRLQSEQRGAKRYSSLRQRSLPENVPQQQPAFGQHPNYYPPEYNQTPSPQSQPGLLPHPTPPIHAQVSNANTQPIIAVPPTSQQLGPPISHQGPPTNGTPLLQAPPQFGTAYPQAPPPYLQPAVAPPSFLPQQAPPQIINYAQPPPQFPQPGYSNFSHQQFTPVTPPQPAELYQSQGGITYYSTQNQQIVPRIQTKRPKAAIPIVPPPEHKEPRGRGRLNQNNESVIGNSIDIQEQIMLETSAENNSVQFSNDAAVTVEQ